MALPFKKNNPGCPCCDCPCACYKFDGDAEDSASSLDLTSTAASYSTGHLDKASKHTGTQYHEHDDHSCFNLGPDGINVWFWINPNYPADYDWGGATVLPEGVITKGDLKENFDGEWGIFFDVASLHATYVGSLSFIVNGGDPTPHTSRLVGVTAQTWTFYFFWVSIEEGKLYLIQNDDSTLTQTLGGDQTLTSDKKLYIGNNTEGKKLGEQTYGGEPRPWLIDNVGFCKDIGTKAEMEERAENLYNDGDGRACNHAGFGSGGCCA
jgi:hypothetical protein